MLFRIHANKIVLRGLTTKTNVHGKHFLPERLRNVGIIAHIDAGKTTVTERLLYLSGLTKFLGNVDAGSTVTDYLEIEKERGITVQSAAISLEWKDHKINLIDTPGHVDFTVEVERCVRVLDGVVTVLDSNAGVQAQTLTVWKQASRFNLPSIFFVNKLDKKNANFNYAVDSVEQKLGMKSVITTAPVFGSDSSLSGILNVLDGTFLDLSSDKTTWTSINKINRFGDEFGKLKESLYYSIADVDESFMGEFLDNANGEVNKIPQTTVNEALRRISINRKGAIISCGTALRNPESVRPVLDQIVSFLPSPFEASSGVHEIFGDELSALVFKITHDKRRGQLSYTRIYTGELKNNTTVYNANREVAEGPLKVFEPQSDDLIMTNVAKAGDVVVLSGLQNTVTGHTLVTSQLTSKHRLNALKDSNILNKSTAVEKENSQLLFSGISFPEPVFFCSIEPPSTASIHDFSRALEEMAIEDPSIKFRLEKETGQTIIETMGELHLEVIKDRFLRFFNLNVFLGPLQIAYRESLKDTVVHTASVHDIQGENARNHSATITLLLEPKPNQGSLKTVHVDLPSGSRTPRPDWMKAIKEGCMNALHNGPVLGFSVQDLVVTLKELTTSGGKVNPAIISACANKCVSEALEKAGAQLVEPLVNVEVHLSGGDGMQPILQDLAKRRAQIEKCQSLTGSEQIIVASMPLGEMSGFSTFVRTASSGLGSLNVQVTGYHVVNEYEQNLIVSQLRG